MAHTCGVNQALLAAALEKLDKLPSVQVNVSSGVCCVDNARTLLFAGIALASVYFCV